VTFQAVVKNGQVILPKGVELPEGTQVRIVVEESDPIDDLADEAVETGIKDLSRNYKKYLYGWDSA